MDYKELAKEIMTYQFRMSKSPKDMQRMEHMKGENSVIGYLVEVQNAVAPSEIARFIGVSTARVASILNKLEDKGLITRVMDTHDRRKIVVCLTDEGRASSNSHKDFVSGKISVMLEALGEHDAKEHVRIMKRIYEISLEHERKGII